MTKEATDEIRAAWDDQAAHWFAQRESLLAASRPIHEWLVDTVQADAGKRVLELAAGPGDTGFMAARRLGAGGRLLSTDIAANMVDAARKRGAELGIDNADYRVLDAQAMDLEDATFDGILCRWAFMLMPDPAAALRECLRVLKPGGRLAFAVFTGPDDNAFASLPGRLLIEMGVLKPSPTGWNPGILALGDRSRLEALLAEVPFGETSIEAVDMAWTFQDTDEYWTFLVELTALAPIVRALPPDRSAEFRQGIDARLEKFRAEDGFVLPSRCWCGVAVR